MSDRGITRKDALIYGGAAAGGAVAGGAAITGVMAATERRKASRPLVGVPIVVRRVEGDLPVTNPDAGAWKDASAALVPLLPQQLVPPYLERGSVVELVVAGLSNRDEVALRVEWEDASVDDLDGIRRFHDGVAIQLPVRAGDSPPITMGGPGAAVHILQWRATWQRDIDSGGTTGVDQIYPEVVHDVMPDDVLPPETASLYWVGRSAANPLSQVVRSTPVEEVVAEGFGTVTHLGVQAARGYGVNDGGRWRVVVAFEHGRPGVGDPLEPGTSWPVAFAVWQGADENRGGRKHVSDWQTLVLEASR